MNLAVLRRLGGFLPFSQFSLLSFLQPKISECYATDEEWARASSTHTNTYVWGEGYQVDSSQEFSNYSPKKIRLFEGASAPDIVDMAFGWYHEAYVDRDGNLYVCEKAKLSSIQIKEIPDGVREPMTRITALPAKTKVKQVAFTKARMFVMS